MAGFAAYEALGDDRYATTAELLVVDGTLRFGAACDDYVDEGFWCIFDSFQLKFVSEDLIGVLKVLYGKDIDQLIAYRDDILKTKPLPPSISNSIVDLRSALDNAEDVETIKEIKKKSEEWKERIDTYITGLIPSLQYSLEYSPYQDECTVTVKPTVTGGTFYWMNENNNLQKGEFENCISTIKFPTDLIGKIDETSITISIYEVETDGLNNQFIMASNKIQLTLTDPTMNVELLDSEWDALKHFVNEIESQGGQTGWDLSQGKSSVNKLKGLRIKRGYVTSINLSGKGLSGDLPLSSSTFSSLQELDFSYNKFEGNAGAFASRLSNLSYLNLAHNRISEVSPMISPNVSSLDISNQAIDKTIDLDFANLNMEQFMAQIPTILLYDHVNQRYNTDLSFICTTSEAESFNFNNTDQWALRLSYKNGQLTMPYVSSQNTFYGQSGDTLKVFALDKNGNWTGNFHICLQV